MLKINEPDGSGLQPKRPPRPRRRTTAVMSVSVEDPPPDVAHARGIVLVPVGRDSRAVALRVYEAHLGTEVFPLLVTPGSPLVGDIPAINAESFVAFPNGAFPGRAQMSAAFQHVRDVPAGRLLVVVEFADLIDAYRFNDIVKTVRKAAGPFFSSRTRMIVLFDERNPVADQFYEAGCFVRDWFLSRTLLVVPAGDPAAAVEVGAGAGAEDEALAELRRRVLGDPGGVWPSDPWVAGMLATINRRRLDVSARGFGGRVLVAATGRGLGAAVNAIAAAFAGEAVETLRLGYRLGTESGRERVVYGDLPFSPLLRESPEFFSTILATTLRATPVETLGKKPKQLVLPRGTRLWWEGKVDPVEIIDAGTVDSATGVHYMAPEAAEKAADVANWLVCWLPAGFAGGASGAVEVRVPMFYGSPAHTRVRAVGLSTRPARELECGASAVVGYVVGFNMLEPSVPPRVPACALTVAPEGFSEDQLGAVVDMVGGAALDLTTAPGKPGAPGRFFLNFAAPYGTGPPRRGPGAAAAAIATGVTRRRTMRVPGMVHGGS